MECATGGLLENVPLIKEERRKAEKLDVQVLFPTWEQDIAGAFPDVPAFLAGDPQCMRRMANQVSDTRPIRIFVGMASSCTFSSEQVRQARSAGQCLGTAAFEDSDGRYLCDQFGGEDHKRPGLRLVGDGQNAEAHQCVGSELLALPSSECPRHVVCGGTGFLRAVKLARSARLKGRRPLARRDRQARQDLDHLRERHRDSVPMAYNVEDAEKFAWRSQRRGSRTRCSASTRSLRGEARTNDSGECQPGWQSARKPISRAKPTK